MATRLNNGMRGEILANAMEGAFDSAIRRDRKALYEATRAVWEDALEKYIKMVNDCPKDFVNNSTDDMSVRLKPTKGKKTIRIDVPRNFKYGVIERTHYYCEDAKEWQDYPMDEDTKEAIDSQEQRMKDCWPICPRYVLDLRYTKGKAPLIKKMVKAHDTFQETRAKAKHLKSTLEAVLKSAYSVEKLLELWPAAANYLPALPVVGTSIAINIPALETLLADSQK